MDDTPTDPFTGAVRRLNDARRRATTALVEPAPPRPGPLPPSGRAGRNLPAAIGVGLGMLAVVGLSLFIRREAFVVLATVAVCLALWELAGAVSQRHIRIPVLPLWVGAVGILVSAWMAGEEAMLMAFTLTAGGVFVWRVLDGGGLEAVRDAAAGIFAAAYVPFLGGFTILLLRLDDGAWLVLTVLLVAVANDVGGYFAGVLFGRTPMAPTISPKKSWEGAAGSLLITSGVATAMIMLPLGGPWWGGPVLGVAAVVAATMGDLAESLLKRDLGLKDMGSLLPGHGGVMDRLDSILICAPVCYGVLRLVL
ncbi:phosphatidate cytidylyltransferase [Georgenia halophila]|uniref:Phosphatidate cytidylyltransferase n=1 Tax=Georgenia halophila TaxID=620889 RepID=A0ABP8L766_9MICO